MSQEYLLDSKNSRLTVHPIKELEIWKFYKIMMAAFWTPEEIDFSNDYDDFQKLSKKSSSYLIDVRTKPEWSFVGIPDLHSLQKNTICVCWRVYPSMEININFQSEILEFGINNQDIIFLICRSGNRSAEAADFLTSKGFINCFNVIDGFEGDIGSHHQRSTINGWKYNKLPWKQ